ncbi:MAG: GNAT family protein [Bacteroidota bacterium]
MNYWEGPLVALRGIEPQDAGFFYEWNKEAYTQQHLDQIWFPSSLLRQEQWVEKQSTKSVEDDGYFFVIVDKTGEKVGMIHVHTADKKNGNFSYAVAIIKAQRGKGYATAAIKMVLKYYFTELRYHKASVGIYAFNEASVKLHQKLGFKEEGRLREMVFSGNQYHDLLKYGLLKREYLSQ